LSETVHQHLHFVLLLFGSESLVTTQPKVSFVELLLSLAPLGGLPNRITNLCIPGKTYLMMLCLQLQTV
jgi:hypothetical protein